MMGGVCFFVFGVAVWVESEGESEGEDPRCGKVKRS